MALLENLFILIEFFAVAILVPATRLLLRGLLCFRMH